MKARKPKENTWFISLSFVIAGTKDAVLLANICVMTKMVFLEGVLGIGHLVVTISRSKIHHSKIF